MFGSQYKDISSKAKTIYSFQQPNKYKDRVIKFNKKRSKKQSFFTPFLFTYRNVT